MPENDLIAGSLGQTSTRWLRLSSLQEKCQRHRACQHDFGGVAGRQTSGSRSRDISNSVSPDIARVELKIQLPSQPRIAAVDGLRQGSKDCSVSVELANVTHRCRLD
jgi:hypothetical protein